MVEWMNLKLSEIAELSKRVYNPNIQSEVLPYIGLEHINEGELRLNSIGSSIEVISNKYQFESNDILFGKLRPYFRKVVKPKFSGICSTDIWVLRSKKGVNQDFLYYFLANWDFVDTANMSDSGTRMPRADWNYLKDTFWSLPPLPEQEAIAEVLSSLDDKIDLLHRNNKTLEQLAETLFRQWFIEEANDSWEEVELNVLTKHLKISINPFLQPNTQFKHYSLPAFDDGCYPQIQFGSEILSNKYQVVDGSILISKLNPATPRVWFINSCESNSVASTEFQVYKSISPYYREYIYYFLKSNDVTDTLIGAASGTSGSHQRVSPDIINKLKIKQPPADTLKMFSEKVSVILDKVQRNTSQIKQLEQLRDTLLPKLMSGEIRIV